MNGYTGIMSADESPIPTPLPRRTLAEQMADSLTEAIVSGEYLPGAMLPIEPALARQFGVSRAVVRDATRMLAARGLVDAQHGRGVFVTESGIKPFSEALFLALRRVGASAWDVERFEQMILPEVFAEAARQATDDEIARIRRLTNSYHVVFAETSRHNWGQPHLSPADLNSVMAAFRAVYGAIFAATHNKVWALLAEPLLRLRMPRSWESASMTVEDFIAHERRVFDARIDAIAGRDPDEARRLARAFVQLPPAAEAAMRATPVGETPQIPLPLTESCVENDE
jgi:GntR family transcriptional repressor for pyruvate dehydrogenase complex